MYPMLNNGNLPPLPDPQRLWQQLWGQYLMALSVADGPEERNPDMPSRPAIATEEDLAKQRELKEAGEKYDAIVAKALDVWHQKRADASHDVERIKLLREIETELGEVLAPYIEKVLSKPHPKRKRPTESQYASLWKAWQGW